MKLDQFKRKGIFFVPSRLPAWLLLFGALCFLVYDFLQIDGASHSASDTLINFAFHGLIVAAVYSLIGYMTSPREQDE